MDLDSAFQILEIDKSAGISEVRAAYRDLAEVWHPDKYTHKPRLAERAAEKMKEINCAYDLIQEHFRDNEHSSKAKPSNEPESEGGFDYIDCINCGIRNRVSKNSSKQNLKCGGCGENPNVKDTQFKSRTKCTDESCFGMLAPDGRCYRCGKTKDEVEKDTGRDENSGPYHPWRRFFARIIDSCGGLLLIFPIVYALALLSPTKAIYFAKLLENQFIAGFVIFALWVPMEATLLSTAGNTPARFLFGISVRTISGQKLSFSQALSRSFQVLLKGVGLGIPFVSIFTQIFAYRRLVRTGTTLWDTANDSVVSHKEWGTGRALLCTLAVVSVLILTGIGNDYNRQHSKGVVFESLSKKGKYISDKEAVSSTAQTEVEDEFNAIFGSIDNTSKSQNTAKTSTYNQKSSSFFDDTEKIKDPVVKRVFTPQSQNTATTSTYSQNGSRKKSFFDELEENEKQNPFDQFDKPINHSSPTVDKTQTDVGPLYRLGITYEESGQRDKAIEIYKKVVHNKPDFAEGWHRLGVCYWLSNHHAKAIDAFQQAVRIIPNDAEIWYYFGRAYAGNREYAKAIAAYQQAIRIKPDYNDAKEYQKHASTLLDEVYQQAVRIRPDDAEAWNSLGVRYDGARQTAKAIDAFQQAVRIKPDYQQALQNLGYAYKASGQAEKAKEVSNRLKALNLPGIFMD